MVLIQLYRREKYKLIWHNNWGPLVDRREDSTRRKKNFICVLKSAFLLYTYILTQQKCVTHVFFVVFIFPDQPWSYRKIKIIRKH